MYPADASIGLSSGLSYERQFLSYALLLTVMFMHSEYQKG